MDREILVSVDLHGTSVFVGRLWWRTRKGRESASFEYDPGWLEHPECFALEPALALTSGPFHTVPGRSLFGAIGDSTPDRWGRLLMRRAERRRARRKGCAPRTLAEADVLLLVDDEARQGALRFSTDPGPFLAVLGGARFRPYSAAPGTASPPPCSGCDSPDARCEADIPGPPAGRRRSAPDDGSFALRFSTDPARAVLGGARPVPPVFRRSWNCLACSPARSVLLTTRKATRISGFSSVPAPLSAAPARRPPSATRTVFSRSRSSRTPRTS